MTKGDYRIQSRLEAQIALMLDELEEKPEMFAFKDRLAFVQIVGMWLTRAVKLGDDGEALAGSTVAKYSKAFRTNVAGRKPPAKPALAYDSGDDEESA